MSDRDPIAHAAEVFAVDVAQHELTVLHDDGLYRHIRFAKPGTGMCHFDLVTWPGHLSFGGDRDGYVFARTTDMFEFFRAKSGWNMGSINPGYWAEKLTTRVKVRTYSEEKFRAEVEAEIAAIEKGSSLPGLAEAIRAEILDEYAADLTTEDQAFAALRDFSFRYEVEVFDPARMPGDKPKTRAEYWSFVDTFEWDIRDWDFHYLYACHAIQWGIDRYDQHRAAVAAGKSEPTLAVEASR